MRVSIVAALSLVLAGAGCNSNRITGSPPGLPHATAVNTCGPTDGPAVIIYLTNEPHTADPNPPFVAMTIWQSVDRLAGQSFLVGAGHSEAYASRALNAAQSVPATSGRIVIESVSSDKEITGTVDLAFSIPGGHVTGRFSAVWMERLILCG